MSTVSAPRREDISSQDDAYDRIRTVLAELYRRIGSEAPELGGLLEHRPARDRPSGTAWRGVETVCHVSALLVSRRELPGHEDRRWALLDDLAGSLDGAIVEVDERYTPLPGRVWRTAAGDRVEARVGVYLTLRATSAPFLPGTLSGDAGTSPVSPAEPRGR